MKISLVTAVWGAWHTDAYLRVTLPTLLAENNLPSMAHDFDCHYQIFTTQVTSERLQTSSGIARLRQLMPVDIDIIARDDRISSSEHLSAWDRMVAEARFDDVAVVSVHPDAPWSNGSFKYMSNALSQGKEIIVVPNVRVISETLVPELESRRADEVIALSGLEMSALALEHLHPLSASMVPQIGRSASATEIYWAVREQGLVLRHASRPAIAAIPSRVPLDIEFYTRKVDNTDKVFNVSNVEEMLMVSLAPLFKDFGLMTLNHQTTPLLLGRWCAHPQNDTPLKDQFAGQVLRLPLGTGTDEAAWRAAERSSDVFMSEVSVNLAAVNLHYALRAQACSTAASILSLALHETRLAQHIRCPPLGGSAILLAPNEEAFDRYGRDRVAEFLLPGREEELIKILSLHYQRDWDQPQAESALNQAGIGIMKITSTDRLLVLIIDRVLDEAL